MSTFTDIGGNGKGVVLSGMRLGIFSRPKRKFSSATTTVPVSPPPSPPPPPLTTFYYAPFLTGGL